MLLICLLAASAYGAQRAMQEGARRVTGFSPTHLTGLRPPSGSLPLAQRLVLIVAEGLRPDDARLLPTVDWLAQRGAQVRVTVPQPGFAMPSAATLLTGARPEVHGAFLPESRLAADNIFSAARRVGLSTGGAGGAAPGKLLAQSLETWETAEVPEDLVAKSRPLLGTTGPRITMLHTRFLAGEISRLKTADAAGSADYRNALARFDFTLAQLVEQVDFRTTAVVLVGSAPAGLTGEYLPGAPLPLVMAGPGVKAGYRGNASLLDIAPTLSALAGTPVPLPNEGRPLLGALQVADGRPSDLVVQRVLEARKAYTEGALTALGSMAAVPDAPRNPDEADAYVAALDLQIREARFAAWRAWGLGMAPYAAGALVLIAAYLIIVWRQPFGGAAYAGAITYMAAFQVIFFLTGGRYSAAMSGLAEPGRGLVLSLAGRSAGAMAIAVLVTGYLLSRKGFKKRAYVAAATCHMAITTALLMALPVAVVLGRTGWNFPIALPGMGLVVWFFVTGLQIAAIGYLSPLWAALAISAAAVSRHWWPLKEIGDPERNADKVLRLKALRRRM